MTITYRQPFYGDWPITQRYGEVIPGVTFNGKPHTGIDYGCPEGTPVLASADGTVMSAGESTTGYGKYVIMQHAGGTATVYAHLSAILVRSGQKVQQGDQIGLSGSTGYATGPHLHFEARRVWNDFTSHFDPMTLPLTSFADAAVSGQQSAGSELKGAEAFAEGDVLSITAPLGAKGWFRGFADYTVYQPGQRFYYTGEVVERNGLEFMQVIPLSFPVWIAANDGDTQILDD